jgi:hypothetical protein
MPYTTQQIAQALGDLSPDEQETIGDYVMSRRAAKAAEDTFNRANVGLAEARSQHEAKKAEHSKASAKLKMLFGST